MDVPADYELPILYARDARGVYRYIEDVPNGDACGCFCPACGQPMRARNAGRKLRHSFAHQPGMTCTWAVEAVIIALAGQTIKESGCVALPALHYQNALTDKTELLSASRLMKVTQVESTTLTGRQAPCLVVTVQGGGQTARFGLCVTLRRKLTSEQAERLLEDTRGIVLVDLGADLAKQRKVLGRHYDRDEIILGYQNEEHLAEILHETSSDLMSWVRNVRREEREERSAAERDELDRRKAEQLALAKREYRERLRREREEQERKAQERAEREAREGIVREPDSYVTEYDDYDVRRWGDRSLPQGKRLRANERYVVNGALEALLVEEQDGTKVIVRCKMNLDAINEVSWKLGELSAGFSRLVLMIDAKNLKVYGQAKLTVGTSGEFELVIYAHAREFCCAIQGLVFRGIAVALGTLDKHTRRVVRVDVDAHKLILK
jgi:hypothetical protein